jgi:predicted DNA-binding transcriptional regulator AlpA
VSRTLSEILARVSRIEAAFNARRSSADEWLTMRAMRESTGSSASSINRRVHDGTIEKSYHMGPKSPRYRIKEVRA